MKNPKKNEVSNIIKLKRILKKSWLFIIILLIICLYWFYYSFSPTITIVNDTDTDVKIYTSHEVVYKKSGVLYAGGVPTRKDLLKISLFDGIIKSGQKKKYKVDLKWVENKEKLGLGDDEFILFSIRWENKNDNSSKVIKYKISEKDEQSLCSVVYFIKNNRIKENRDGFCLRKMVRVFD